MTNTPSEHNYHVYILTNNDRSCLYIDVTENLPRRLQYHESTDVLKDAYSHKNKCINLVFFENHDSIKTALERKDELKTLERAMVKALVSKGNPEWRALNAEINFS